MSEKEKAAAEELLTALKKVPDSARDYMRGYLQGRADGIKEDKNDAGRAESLDK